MRYAIYVWEPWTDPARWVLTANPPGPIVEGINQAYHRLEAVIAYNRGRPPLADQYLVVEENTDMTKHPPPVQYQSGKSL